MVFKKFAGQRETLAEGYHLIVHPLDDVREEKIDMSHLGLMTLTPSAKAALFVLRGYLVLMIGLVAFRVFMMAQGGF